MSLSAEWTVNNTEVGVGCKVVSHWMSTTEGFGYPVSAMGRVTFRRFKCFASRDFSS